jgi:tripartite-type tricarboxylate transporter receptor subunit TctC
VVQTLNRQINQILKDESVRKLLETQGAEALGGSPEDLSALIRQDSDRWGKIIRAANIKLD